MQKNKSFKKSDKEKEQWGKGAEEGKVIKRSREKQEGGGKRQDGSK